MAAAPVSIRRARPLLGTFVEIAVADRRLMRPKLRSRQRSRPVATVHRLMSFHEAGSDVGRLNAVRRRARFGSTTGPIRCSKRVRPAPALGGVFDVSVAPAQQRASLLPSASPFPACWTLSPQAGRGAEARA